MNKGTCLTAASLVMVAGSCVLAAPVIDGVKSPSDNYPAALWVNANPTGFGDNIAGQGGGAPSLGNPRDVNTGIEIAIPYSAIGYAGGPLKIAAMIGSPGNGSMSNQVLGGLPLNTPNQGSYRDVNFDTAFAGNQYIQITPTAISPAPTIDGVRDAAYGGLITVGDPRLQTNYTGYGKSNHGQAVRGPDGTQNGSEIDNIYVASDGSTLYIHLGGNLEANFNSLAIFIDSDNNAATGQNHLLGGNLRDGLPDGAASLNNMSDDGSNNGLRFDAAFGPDYYIGINGGNTATAPDPEVNSIFVDFATLPTAGAGVFQYAGKTGYAATATALIEGDAGAPALRASVTNVNVNGVAGDPIGTSNAAPNADFAYGSELDALYAYVEGGKLYFMLTGNLQKNYNALIVLVDVAPGGQNRLRGASRNVTTGVGTIRWRGNVDIDFNNLNNGLGASNVIEDVGSPGTLVATNGLTFDADFDADYIIRFANGDNNNDQVARNFANAAFLRTGGRAETLNNTSLDFGAFDGGIKASFNPIVFGGPRIDDLTGADSQTQYAPRLLSDQPQPIVDPSPFANLIRLSIDNSNVGGVTGAAADQNAALAVTTGLEGELDLNELGWDGTSPIKFTAFISGGNWNFMSNSVVGLPAGTANLGDARNVNFANIAGDQYVIIPVGGSTGCNLADITEVGGTEEFPGNPDGQLTVDDLILFVNLFSASTGCPGTAPCSRADVTGIGGNGAAPDGELTVDDLIEFVNAFSTGC